MVASKGISVKLYICGCRDKSLLICLYSCHLFFFPLLYNWAISSNLMPIESNSWQVPLLFHTILDSIVGSFFHLLPSWRTLRILLLFSSSFGIYRYEKRCSEDSRPSQSSNYVKVEFVGEWEIVSGMPGKGSRQGIDHWLGWLSLRHSPLHTKFSANWPLEPTAQTLGAQQGETYWAHMALPQVNHLPGRFWRQAPVLAT